MPKVPPPRPLSRSNDDLSQVSALEAAEERARAALRLVEQAELEKAQLQHQLEHARAQELQRQLDAIARATRTTPTVEMAPAPESKSSQRPGVLTVQAKGLKVGIPLALLTPALALVWAGYQHYTEYTRQVKVLSTIIADYDKKVDDAVAIGNRALEENAKLKVTVAELSGYLVGVLPKAGVNVPGTGTEIKADPLPPNARRQTPVNVRTPVPSPQ